VIFRKPLPDPRQEYNGFVSQLGLYVAQPDQHDLHLPTWSCTLDLGMLCAYLFATFTTNKIMQIMAVTILYDV
jgi:hypothetical protein